MYKTLDINDLSILKFFILKGASSTDICKQYNIARQTLVKIVKRDLEDIFFVQLDKNNKYQSYSNHVKNGSKKGENNNKHYPLIKKLLYKGLSSMKIKNHLQQHYNIKISHTAVIRVLRVNGTKDDLAVLRKNARAIQAQCVLDLMQNKTSIPEQMLRDIVLQYYPTAKWKYPIKNSKGFYWEIDIALPEHNIAFEYDCIFWHNKERDVLRDKDLNSLGWNVIRFIYKENPTYETLSQDFLNRIKNIPELAC